MDKAKNKLHGSEMNSLKSVIISITCIILLNACVTSTSPEKPKVISCIFDKKYLKIPKEIIIITMQHHQRYFPTFDKKDNLTNNFFIVADSLDPKSFVKIGNERVIDARLSDAEFFWNKNKSQNLVKQISKLKNVNYFKGLGSYYDKTQRIRKLSGWLKEPSIQM